MPHLIGRANGQITTSPPTSGARFAVVTLAGRCEAPSTGDPARFWPSGAAGRIQQRGGPASAPLGGRRAIGPPLAVHCGLRSCTSAAPSRTMPSQEPDPSRCPLCGQPNQCAMAAGLAPESCWCMTAPIAPGALDALHEAERGQRCICQACGARGIDTGQPPI